MTYITFIVVVFSNYQVWTQQYPNWMACANDVVPLVERHNKALPGQVMHAACRTVEVKR